MLQKINTKYWILISGLSGILCLVAVLPFFRFVENKSSSSNIIISQWEVFGSSEFKIAGISLIVLSCPTILDIIMDFIENYFTNNISKVWLGRTSYAATTFFIGLLFLQNFDGFHIFKNHYAIFRFIMCCYHIVMCTNLIYCVSMTHQFLGHTVKISIFVSCYMVINGVLQLYTLISNPNSDLLVIAAITKILWISICSVFTVFSLYHFSQKKSREVGDYCILLYLIVFAVVELGVVFLNFGIEVYYSNSDLIDSGSIEVLTHSYTMVAASVMMIIFPGRIALYESSAIIVSKDEIITSKQSYVRYISHEIRTPMNTIEMGLQFLVEQIPKETRDVRQRKFLTTLVELGMACEVALEIVNDLLLYDKLQNETLEIKKTDVKALEFITKCIDMFTVQVKAKNIKLKLINLDDDNEDDDYIQQGQVNTSVSAKSTQSYASFKSRASSNVGRDNINNPYARAISMNDKLFVDKSKLGQVIRNIMSNAIKFTPDNGCIQVTVMFEHEIIESSYNETYGSIASAGSFDSVGNHQLELNGNLSIFSKVYYQLGQALKYGNEMLWLTRRSCNKDETTRLIPHQSEYDVIDAAVPSYCDNVDVASVKGRLIIKIQDSGAGISIENQSRLFKEIVQFDSDRLQAGGGSGLGLWITKGILDAHEGNISVHSPGEGQGTTFCIEIPMTRSLSSMQEDSQMSSIENFHSRDRRNSINTETLSILHSNEQPLFTNIISSFNDAAYLSNRDNTSAELPETLSRKRALLNTQSIVESSSVEENSISNSLGFHSSQQEQIGLKINTSVKLKALLVDDSASNRKMLRHLLEDRGFYCDEAVHGRKGVDMVIANMALNIHHNQNSNNNSSSSSSSSSTLENENVSMDDILNRMRPYDVILMDYEMPEMNGPDATKAIRKLGYNGLIIGVTGNGLDQDIDLFRNSGLNDIIIKPLKINNLVKMIRELLFGTT